MKRRLINLLKRIVYSRLPIWAVGRWFTVQALHWITKPQNEASCINAINTNGRVLYVAASTLPYHISGYATRTQAILKALQESGVDAACITRPGYPSDRPDSLQKVQGNSTEVDGVVYWHTFSPNRYLPTFLYAIKAAKPIMAEAKRLGVTRIHAASNHVNALPALVAARKLGLPFSYEMRGLWELTRISREPDYEGSHAYKQGLMLESLVARNADRLFVISEQLGNYMQAGAGVDAKKIRLLPNCVNEAGLAASNKVKNDHFVLGYTGTVISYEGLDILVKAMRQIADKQLPVQVHIVGGGEALEELQEQVANLGMSEHILFFGRVTPTEAKAHLANMDVMCMPRKDFQVCRIVTPIKLVEALAMGKPVILPDLPVFRDETASGEYAFFFEANNPHALADTIEQLYQKRDTLTHLSESAVNYVSQQRLWKHFVQEI